MTETRFKVAAAQVRAGQISGPVGDLDRLESLTAEAAEQGARLVCWPECSYPAYFLRSAEHYRETASRRIPFERVVRRVAGIAKRHRIYLIAGLVEELAGGKLANAAMLFDPRGRHLLTHRKCSLWHFDHRYFVPGDRARVVETELGRIGLMICADGRCPEVAAVAARQGVQLLVNPTAWVTTGRHVEALTNPQIEFFLPARAMENGCWILSADKVGVEAGSIVYCGRSNLISPNGELVAALGPGEEGLLVAEVDLSRCRPATEDASPILASRLKRMAVTARRAEPVRPDASVVLATMACEPGKANLTELSADLEAEGVKLLLLPARSGGRRPRRPGQGPQVVFAGEQTRLCRCGPLRFAGGPVESFVPARAAMLGGAELFIARAGPDGRCPDLRVLRTRAAENRIYVAAAAKDRAVVVAPNGAVLADTLEGRSMAALARLVLAAARDKLMAPGTDVVRRRNVKMYCRCLE